MYIGLEIGGTKLQAAVGRGDGTIIHTCRQHAKAERGGESIRAQILELMTTSLSAVETDTIRGIGVGFGGPVDVCSGQVARSHQVEGWDGFPLVEWLTARTGLSVAMHNDADTAGLGEALYGAGRGAESVFYMTVGSGIGGGLILKGEIYRGSGAGAAEVGHMRVPEGLCEEHPACSRTVESLASGWSIALAARKQVASNPKSEPARDLMDRAGGSTENITTQLLGVAALEGNDIALSQLRVVHQVLGWTIAQVIALLCPEAIVVGGGVSLLPEHLFLDRVQEEIHRHLFEPFRGHYTLTTAQLGESVVLHGALALARLTDRASGPSTV